MPFLFRGAQRVFAHLAPLAAITALAGACDDSAPLAGMGDARTEDSSAKTDADAPPSMGDDAGCACTLSDEAEVPISGSMPLSCFCDVPNRCRTFDDSVRCNGDLSEFLVIETYTDCNFVSVRLEAPFAGYRRTYEAATHELVGATTHGDFPALACGASLVFGLRAGVDPFAAGCHVARREVPCPGGRAEPPPDADRPDVDASLDADAGPPIPDADAGPPVPDADAGPPIPDADADPSIPDADAGPPILDADASPSVPDADAGCTCTDSDGGYAPEVWDG